MALCSPARLNGYFCPQLLQALRLLGRALPRTKEDPADLETRADCQTAMWLAVTGMGRWSRWGKPWYRACAWRHVRRPARLYHMRHVAQRLAVRRIRKTQTDKISSARPWPAGPADRRRRLRSYQVVESAMHVWQDEVSESRRPRLRWLSVTAQTVSLSTWCRQSARARPASWVDGCRGCQVSLRLN